MYIVAPVTNSKERNVRRSASAMLAVRRARGSGQTFSAAASRMATTPPGASRRAHCAKNSCV